MNQKTPIRNSLNRLIRPIVLGLVLALALPAPEASADSLREVAERVARQHDAKKVISARVVERGGRQFYVIRILTQDDVIKTIRVPVSDRKYLAHHVGAVSDRDRTPGSVANRSLLPQQANKVAGAVGDRDRTPGSVANQSSLPQQGNAALGAVSDRDLTSSVFVLVMSGPDRASSVRCVGPGPALHLTGLPVKPAMTQEPPASANRT